MFKSNRTGKSIYLFHRENFKIIEELNFPERLDQYDQKEFERIAKHFIAIFVIFILLIQLFNLE